MAIITLAGGLIGLLFGFFAHRLRCCRRLAVIEFARGSHEGKLTVWGHTGGLLFGAARRGVGAGGFWSGAAGCAVGAGLSGAAVFTLTSWGALCAINLEGLRLVAGWPSGPKAGHPWSARVRSTGLPCLRRAPANSRRYFPPGIVCRSSSVSALDSTRCSPSKTTSNTFLS